MLEIRVQDDGVVALKGRLDAAEADRALAALQALPGPVTLDCSGLEYISSAGIGVIMQTFKRLMTSGKTLQLNHLSPSIRKVFDYAGLSAVLRLS